MTISSPVASLLLPLLAALLVVNVSGHTTWFKSHFDNPPACEAGQVKNKTSGDMVDLPSVSGGAPCIVRESYLTSDMTCGGEAYSTVTLIADEDCWHVPNTNEYYKLKCDTDLTIAGRMLCNKGCTDCVESNFNSGFSDSLIEMLEGKGKNIFTSIPVDGTCVSFNEGGGWGRSTGEATEVSVDYKFTGQCVANPYEGAFDDPDHFVMKWLNGNKAPLQVIIAGIVLCALSMASCLFTDDPDSCRPSRTHHNGWMEVFDILFLFGGALLFLGLFVQDKITCVGLGFVLLFSVVATKIFTACTHCQLLGYKDEDKAEVDGDNGDLSDDSGAETSTKYMDFEKPLPKLFILILAQMLLMFLLCTEMTNYWGDEGAEYDVDFSNLEARNFVFFLIAVCLQPGQYDELFGAAQTDLGALFAIVTTQHSTLQIWQVDFDPAKGFVGQWKNLSLENHPRWERFIRWILMAVGGWLVPMLMMIFTPILLTFSGTALDFVMNAFALAFIGGMDNAEPTRFRLTKDEKRIAAGEAYRVKLEAGRQNESHLPTTADNFGFDSNDNKDNE